MDIKNTMIMVSATTAAITRTLLQDIPEKLPSDQLCRLTMLESSANVTTKSVTAEQIYPIMTPLMTSMDILWTFFATSRTNPIEIMEPIKAAMIIAADPMEIASAEKEDHQQSHHQFCTGRNSQYKRTRDRIVKERLKEKSGNG